MSLSAKIAGGLVLLALLAVLVPGWFFWVQVEERMQELRTLEATELQAALRRRLAELQVSVREIAERLARELAADRLFLTAASSAGAPPAAVRVRAAQLLGAAGLDFLWIVDGGGQVVSCGHLPEAAGSHDPELAARPPGRAAVHRRRAEGRRVLSLEVAEVVPSGLGLRLVAGVRLDEAARRQLGGDDDLAWALVDEEARLLAARPWPLPVRALPPSVRRSIAEGGVFQEEIAAADGSRFLVAGLPLVGERRVQGSLLALRGLAGLSAWRGRLLTALGLAALAAVAMAALGGVLLARRIGRPVRELTAGAGRMAAGDLNLDLPVRSSDEIGQLTDAFNSMAAALRQGRRDLAASERLAAWRDAARRMAHEVKNPLAPIRMSVENLQRARSMSPEAFERLFTDECRTILEEVDALKRLVDSFSRFARLPEPARRQVAPEELVRHAAELYAASLDSVLLDVRLDAGLPAVSADPELMGQVLKNLLANALDAVPRPGGRILLECRRGEGTVVFSVTDNGPGIPEVIREHLFEPQVTTKSTGSGLGLAVSRQIVERHGGRIEVDTSERGTTFRVVLPLAAEEKRWPAS